MTGRQGPLTGLRVVELAHIMAGPVCGLMLADLGAEVIKVEKLPGGDDSRRFLPPEIEGEPAAIMMMNRNKRGVAIDLKQADGKAVLRRLLVNAIALNPAPITSLISRAAMVAGLISWGLIKTKCRPDEGAPLLSTTRKGVPNSLPANWPGLPTVALEAIKTGSAP